MNVTILVLCLASAAVTIQAATSQPMLYGATQKFRTATPPVNGTDEWTARSKLIGTSGWNQFQFLFMDPSGVLHAVKNGKFYKRSPPQNSTDQWLATATDLGTSDEFKYRWDQFKFLFFDPEGKLYAATKDGKFYKGQPATANIDNWMERTTTTEIGTSGWDGFSFLFFDPRSSNLYARLNGDIYRASPPISRDDQWLKRATKVGNRNWKQFKFLFCDPNGVLYGATKNGKFYMGAPPDGGVTGHSWIGNAKEVGTSGWSGFDFLFF